MSVPEIDISRTPPWSAQRKGVLAAIAGILIVGAWIESLRTTVPQQRREETAVSRPITDSHYSERYAAERARIEAEARAGAARDAKAERVRDYEQAKATENRSKAEPNPLVQKFQQMQLAELDALFKAGSAKSQTPATPLPTRETRLAQVRTDLNQAAALQREADACLEEVQSGRYACAEALRQRRPTLKGTALLSVNTTHGNDGQMTDGSDYSVPPGTNIVVALDQDMTSDLLGPFSATVTQPVYDPSGQYILIPAGARLNGENATATTINEVIAPRVNSKMTWLTYPDGRSLDLSKHAIALDATGKTGIPGEMDYHLGTIATGALISLLFSAPGYMLNGGDLFSPQQAALNGLASTSNRTGQRIAERYLSVVPSKTLQAGEPLVIRIRAPLHLPVWEPVDMTELGGR